MMMEPFDNRFLEIARKETRCVIIPRGKTLPEGEYFFVESYCNDKKCDCRRVFINVYHNGKPVATIGYGWEELEYYEKWMGDKKLAKDVKGPILEIDGFFTEYSDEVFNLFNEIMLKDSVFIARLKKHYELFKTGKAIK